MLKIKRVRHLVMGIALSAAGSAQGAKSAQEANEFINKILEEGFHKVEWHVLRSTFTESGDPAFVQNEYLFTQYEDAPEEAPIVRAGRAKKTEEPVPA